MGDLAKTTLDLIMERFRRNWRTTPANDNGTVQPLTDCWGDLTIWFVS